MTACHELDEGAKKTSYLAILFLKGRPQLYMNKEGDTAHILKSECPAFEGNTLFPL